MHAWLCIGHPWEWFGTCNAMLESGLLPDFIVVDGAEGGTGAAPLEFTDHVGAPLQEGLLLVHNALTGLGLRPRIKIGAAGKVIGAFDIARRVTGSDVRLLASLLPVLEPGALLPAVEGRADWPHNVYRLYWPRASAHSFAAA